MSWSRLRSTTCSASSIDSSATRPCSSAIARSVARRMSSCARSRSSRRVGLGPGDQVLAHLLRRLPGLLDDPPASLRASASCGWYSLEHALGLGLRLLGPLEVVADAGPRGPRAPVLIAGHAFHAEQRRSTMTNADRRPRGSRCVSGQRSGSSALHAPRPCSAAQRATSTSMHDGRPSSWRGRRGRTRRARAPR